MLMWIILTKMSHETRLVENSNVFLEFITLDYHVVNIPFSNFYSTHTAITYLPINKNKNKKQKKKSLITCYITYISLLCTLFNLF